MPKTSKFSVTVADDSRRALVRALRVLGDKDAPWLEAVLHGLGTYAHRGIRQNSPGIIAPRVVYNRVTGSGAGKVATVRVKHPAILPFEFGRTKWVRYRRGGIAQHYPGFVPRPIVGIKEGNLIAGEVADRAAREIPAAIAKEWERVVA